MAELRHLPPPRTDDSATAHRPPFHGAPHHFPSNPRGPAAFSAAAEPPQGVYHSQSHPWHTDADTGSEDDDYDDAEEESVVRSGSGSLQSSSDKIYGVREKDGDCVRGGMTEEQHRRQDDMGRYENAVMVVEPESYCQRAIHGVGMAHKEVEGGGRREVGSLVDPGESLRVHLSDPVTGVLMDDAMILRCGHSFSSSGMQHVHRTKACYKCSQPVSEDSARPNLSLRYAVQAFRREEESQSLRASKRKRDRFEQDKCGYDESCPMDARGKGVQFPYVVADRVVIKGNKRTPERFVGRMAVVTTQCLNGWYVVKTMDNAESVKLQYRSLAKVAEDSSSNTLPNRSLSSNWL